MKIKFSIVGLLLLICTAMAPAHAADMQQNKRVYFAVFADQASATEEHIMFSEDLEVTWVSDRPMREAGVMGGTEFLKSWRSGPDSFLVNPPNAVLTGAGPDGRVHVVVELMSPEATGGGISFTYKLLHGQIVPKMTAASLFIDPATSGGQFIFSSEAL
ncbi:MAG: hypothetical protein AAGA50_20495 [Pseudomonadota bacterium]